MRTVFIAVSNKGKDLDSLLLNLFNGGDAVLDFIAVGPNTVAEIPEVCDEAFGPRVRKGIWYIAGDFPV